MPELKLPKLPDRAPVKLTVVVTPVLHQALSDYAALYAQTYGREEAVTELIPAMVLSWRATELSLPLENPEAGSDGYNRAKAGPAPRAARCSN